MKTKSSFILTPSIYNQLCNAELHIVVVNYDGMRLGVIATASTLYHLDGRRILHHEALDELPDYELTIVIQRVRREIAEGKIDKGFLYFVNQQSRKLVTEEVLGLFLLPPDDKLMSIRLQGDQINALLEKVKNEYID